MDGAVGLTQSPTGPSKSFTYKFHIAEAQSGSFWYHSHSELQRADGLYGGIVIHKPASSGVPSENEVHNYDQDVGLLIGDWYHRPSHEVQVYYEDFANAGNEKPAPDSLLINGQGYFNCSLAVPARPLVCQKIMIPQLNLNINNTRLRLINTGAIVGFTISIAGYDMHLIEVDGGGEVSGGLGSSSIGVIYPGERVDIILGPNLHFDKSKMVMSIELDAEYGGPSMPTEALAPLDLARVAGPPRVTTGMPKTPSQTLVLYTKVEILGEFGNRPRGFINQSTWEAERLEKMPLLALDKTAWGNAFVPFVKTGEDRWVDIVLNNFDDRGHPFHLHGNDFFVLSVHEAGIGGYDEAYNPFDTARPPAGGPLNTMNPVRKDTIFIPAMGYAVLRFKADNEGLWFFHCHILWHQAVGMAMALHVGSD
ncbi:putative Laccase-2 [Glarea lozoyensis 74030]|uniref:Putative Laccase-2 n=1 Tax=Glarea lozoyensis (strain ATCC 74030 / MF5533) TaxID=1104152 RepID=H0EYN9_GLAL7|nr:putative Laccase-2 [Glarea lozoyensis 74030]